jgi:AcrR family transcriptional regulator
MSRPVNTRRTYTSPVRAERAAANRRRVLVEARRRFVADGYARTSVAAVARAAGVSEDLVFHLFGTKRGLLTEVLNFAVTEQVDSPVVLEQVEPRRVREETDQRRQIALFAADIARRTARGRPIDDVIRGAAEVDPQVAELRAELQRTRLANLTVFVGWVAARGPLRAGVDSAAAAATVWTLTGPDVHRLLTDELGWTHERYAGWLRDTLEVTLLGP